MTKKEVESLAKIYCGLYKGEEKADLLNECLKADSDFKDYLLKQIDWNMFKKFVEENKREFRRANLL